MRFTNCIKTSLVCVSACFHYRPHTARPSSLGLESHADYAGDVALIDEQIRQISTAIKRRGEWDETLVVIVSDYDEMDDDAELIYKSSFFDGALWMPLRVKRRGAVDGVVCTAPVEWIDIGPIRVEVAGGEIDYPQFGRLLHPMLNNPQDEHRVAAISEYAGESMLLDREWKVVLNACGEIYLLYDVQNDPNEAKNLADRPGYTAIEGRLRRRLLKRLVSTQLQRSSYRFDQHDR